jgi:hypothetical protein
MPKGTYLRSLLRADKTVFSLEDVALLWKEPVTQAARARLTYYIRKGELHRIRRGLYARDKRFDALELATRIFTPSYVSFEAALVRADVILRCSPGISVASRVSREITCGGHRFRFRKLKDEILTDPAGVEHRAGRSMASPERALLDTLYLFPAYRVDNPYGLDWERIFEWLPLYRHKRLARRVMSLYHHAETHL